MPYILPGNSFHMPKSQKPPSPVPKKVLVFQTGLKLTYQTVEQVVSRSLTLASLPKLAGVRSPWVDSLCLKDLRDGCANLRHLLPPIKQNDFRMVHLCPVVATSPPLNWQRQDSGKEEGFGSMRLDPARQNSHPKQSHGRE